MKMACILIKTYVLAMPDLASSAWMTVLNLCAMKMVPYGSFITARYLITLN